jgi:hypothetical protein
MEADEIDTGKMERVMIEMMKGRRSDAADLG